MSSEGSRVVKATNRSAVENEHVVQIVADGIADEVFCWLPTIIANRGVPLATNYWAKHKMFLWRVSSSAGRACFHNEYSDDV
jgi:hypothetical protein